MADNAPLALLLLPPPPQPSSTAAVSAAYRPPINAALRRLKRSSANTSTPASIDIALPYPDYTLGQSQCTFSGCETPLLHTVQELLISTYTLISAICDELQQEQTSSGNSQPSKNGVNVDVSVILLGYDKAFNYDTLVRPARSIPSCDVDLSILALSDRNWSHLYVTEGEPGERLYRQFRALVNGNLSSRVGGTWKTERVPGGMVFNMSRQTQAVASETATAVTASGVTATKQQVMVIGEEEARKETHALTLDLDQKLRLSIALLFAEFHGTHPPENEDTDESGSGTPFLNPSVLKTVQFLQSIVDWRIAGDRFAKAQPASSRLRFDGNTDGSIKIRPWGLILLTDAPRQLQGLFVGSDNRTGGDEDDLEYTVVLSESQKDDVIALLTPLKDRCRMVVCKDLAASSSTPARPFELQN
ncbi:hypothetical protein AJ79_07270 [Helicocarpus griseus UAMH5409]|uniref:Uncharacterized protein n=1 Tax=Helicocarpus griseus UAMH5409 TaxID=1447875 RepID=A0A2B7WWM5_9EURO|nr:hypothetical protein AJ79_07270 [Helicocarpus griseus UAMH5409]